MESFAENGYSNVGIRNISKGTGLSSGAIYYHFSSKKKIAQFLYDTAIEILLNKIVSAVEKSPNDREALKSIIFTLFKLTDEEPHLMKYVLYTKHKDFLPEALPICSAKPFEYIKKFIKAKIKEGVFRDMDILIASSLIMGPVIRIIQLKMESIIQKDLIGYTDPLFDGISKSIFKNKH
ncbi:MAG: TetR/AcrR family transcriptional regulator [bacterium]|jgi:Transcriptional regulator